MEVEESFYGYSASSARAIHAEEGSNSTHVGGGLYMFTC